MEPSSFLMENWLVSNRCKWDEVLQLSRGFPPVIQVGSGPVDDGHEVVADRLDSGGRQVPHGLLPVLDVPEVMRKFRDKELLHANAKYCFSEKGCEITKPRITPFGGQRFLSPHFSLRALVFPLLMASWTGSTSTMVHESPPSSSMMLRSC